MKLNVFLFAILSLLSTPAAWANYGAETDLDASVLVVRDEDVLDEPVADEEISEELTIVDDSDDFAEWLNTQEEENSETVYVDEEGNEYYISSQDYAGKGQPVLKKKRKKGARAQKRNCSASSGGASWYGPGFHGKKTANGERFNQNALTAAHKTLRFGSIVRVTYKGRSVDVRINDAGPYAGGRVIDLSKAAAQKIGLIGAGHGQVTLKVISCG